MSKINLSCPECGWSTLTINDTKYDISYVTNAGWDILAAAFRNYICKGKGANVTIIDGEKSGKFYLIFENNSLTICSTDDDFCKHYYFISAKNLLTQISNSISEHIEEWGHFYCDDEVDSTKDIQTMLRNIKCEVEV